MKKYYIGFMVLLLVLLATLIFPKYGTDSNKVFNQRKSESASIKDAKHKSLLPDGAIIGTAEDVEMQRSAERLSVLQRIEAALNTSITFSGRVVDQNGDPVPNANVRYSSLDKFNKSGSGAETIANGAGYIEIQGVKGAVLGINVSKEGYHQIHNVSNQRFAYGIGPDGITKPPPTKDNPAVFVLHKMEKTEPLIELSSRQFQIPASGQAVVINLSTGGRSEPGLHISSKVGEVQNGRFDWSYKLLVPEGGLVELNGQFDFEAPIDGYESSVLLESKASNEDWKNGTTKSYFVRLSDKTYARIQVRFYPRAYRNIVVLESHLNPAPGSRNLEYDRTKTVFTP